MWSINAVILSFLGSQHPSAETQSLRGPDPDWSPEHLVQPLCSVATSVPLGAGRGLNLAPAQGPHLRLLPTLHVQVPSGCHSKALHPVKDPNITYT